MATGGGGLRQSANNRHSIKSYENNNLTTVVASNCDVPCTHPTDPLAVQHSNTNSILIVDNTQVTRVSGGLLFRPRTQLGLHEPLKFSGGDERARQERTPQDNRHRKAARGVRAPSFHRHESVSQLLLSHTLGRSGPFHIITHLPESMSKNR